jgi:uncharacterized repeat protein (TIGR03803 family)
MPKEGFMPRAIWKAFYSLIVLATTGAVSIHGQTFTTLVNFDIRDGHSPVATLLQSSDGNLYGTTLYGGSDSTCKRGCGTLFGMTARGTLTSLASFATYDYPQNGVLQATNGTLYGTTSSGGDLNCKFGSGYGCGTVFTVSSTGEVMTLYTFCSRQDCIDGAAPSGTLIQATGGNFYGTTLEGGLSSDEWCENGGCGTIFKITPEGALTTLYEFCEQYLCLDGAKPNAGVIQGTDGNLYGTTTSGGANNGGTVFKITLGGNYSVLYSFDSYSDPTGALIQGTNGNFYGTTYTGAEDDGTVFQVTQAGVMTTLHRFLGGPRDGAYPYAGLIQGSDGNFYGTTVDAGAGGSGTVFEITPAGVLTLLHSFCADGDSRGSPPYARCPDGKLPYAALTQDTNGEFYGSTYEGGAGGCGAGCGTIFSLSLGLGPFVETQPSTNKVGGGVGILGTDLTGATSVTFNGVAAVFRVVSSSLISASVPPGASTGLVSVTTSSGTLTSNKPFIVKP